MTGNKTYLALALFFVTLMTCAITVPQLLATWDVENEGAWGFRGFGIAAALVFAGSGVLLASKRPKNPIGWLFLVAGLSFALLTLGETYVVIPLLQGRSGGLIYQVAWFTSWSWVIFLAAIAFAILLFPSGDLPSPRWRPRARFMAVGFVLGCVSFGLGPGSLNNLPEHVTNRYALPAGPVTDGFIYFSMLAFLAAVVAAAVGVVQRFRASVGLERQQMKLFVLAAGVMAASLAMVPPSESLAPAVGDVLEFVSSFAMMAIPISMAIAILKHRLYEIDVIINRTLVYAALTAALLGSYLLIVVVLGRVLNPVVRDSDVAVAASTLAVAALFRPLRARIQGFIDRRFYRSKYDASRAIAAFSARLRDEIDVDTVREDVVGVVGTTVQPAHVSVWIRPEATS